MEKAVMRDMSTFQLWIIAIALVVFGAVLGELTGEICYRIMVRSWNQTCWQQVAPVAGDRGFRQPGGGT